MPRAEIARWSASLTNTRALSVKQPWAWLIVNGFKDIENRSWRTNHRGPLLIHAGLDESEFTDYMADHILKKYRVEIPELLKFGGVIGVADLVACHESHPSKWYVPGNYAWELANPRLLRPRPCKGALSLFVPEFDS